MACVGFDVEGKVRVASHARRFVVGASHPANRPHMTHRLLQGTTKQSMLQHTPALSFCDDGRGHDVGIQRGIDNR